jgi:hypothetical protein
MNLFTRKSRRPDPTRVFRRFLKVLERRLVRAESA